MLKFINFKNLTAFGVMAILAVGLIAKPVSANNGRGNGSSGQTCNSNNGHGNNEDITVELSTGKIITITRFDPSNAGNGGYLDRRIAAADFDLSDAEISELKSKIQSEDYDRESSGSGSGSSDSDDSNSAGIVVSIEAPTIQTTQLPDASEYFVINFNDVSTGRNAFGKSNGGVAHCYSGKLEVKTANQWGGANGSKFITQENISSIRSYTFTVGEEQKYFGFWWSAGDPYNQITFKNNGEAVAVFETEDLVDFIESSGVENTADYYGNPAYSGSDTGHLNEPFAFVNVFFKKGAYDEIVVATLTEGGSAFESDNHTFSPYDQEIRGSVLPGATTPAGINDLIVTDEDNATTANILNNDINPNQDIEITKITINGEDYDLGETITLASGALLTVTSDGQTTFDPDNNFEDFTIGNSHTDQFSYTIEDSEGNTDSAEVTLRVQGVADAPVAINDSHTTDEDTKKWMMVLQNDSDADTDKEDLRITAIDGKPVTSFGNSVVLDSGATVVLKEQTSEQNTNGKYALEYDPTTSSRIQELNDGQNYPDTFTYTVTDQEGKTGQGTVNINVTGITDYLPD